MTTEKSGVRDRLLTLIAVIAVIWVLQWSYPVAMPVVVAIFVIAAVWPVKPWLDNTLPSSLSYAGTVLVLVAIVGAFFAVIYFSIAQISDTFAENQERFRSLYDSYVAWADSRGLPVPGGEGGYDRLVELAQAIFWRLYNAIAYLGIIAVIIIMGLPEVPVFAAKLREQLHAGESRELVDTVAEIAKRCRQYIGVTVVTSLITGVACSLWAFAVGLDLALIWGVMNFLLNFIPVVGNIVGIIPPSLYAMVQFDSWTMVLVVFVGYAVLQVVISNFVYPMLQGRGMAMPPVAIVVSLIFWGWIWGGAGALLAVPLTAALLIVFQHFRSTAWLARLLSREE